LLSRHPEVRALRASKGDGFLLAESQRAQAVQKVGEGEGCEAREERPEESRQEINQKGRGQSGCLEKAGCGEA
jgi:hypothetical protein